MPLRTRVRSSALVVGLLLVAAASLPSLAPAGAATPKLPDLRVTDAGILTPTLRAGQRSTVKVSVRNAGRATSAATTVTFALSTDAKLGRDVPLAGLAKVPALKPGATVVVTGTLTMGRRVKVGAYRVFACVDVARRVRESSDRNNCPAGERVGVVAKPTPVNVTVATVTGDSAIVGRGSIGVNGGRLVATDGAGTTYTLVVPPRALASGVQVTMTPIASIAGLPFAGGLTGGVQLEPSGLEFTRPATLAISNPSLDVSVHRARLSFDGAGRDLHLVAPWRAVPSSVSSGFDPEHTLFTPVEHFSGVALAPATSSEEAVQYVKRSVSAQNALQQEASRLLERNASAAEFQRFFDRAMDEQLLPAAAAAAYSDDLYAQAVRMYVAWVRQQQLLGTGATDSDGLAGISLDGHWTTRNAEFNRLMDLAWKQVVIRLEADCRRGRFDTLSRIIGLERQRALLGVGDDPTPNQFSEALRRCMHFELSVTSDLVKDQDLDANVSQHYHWRLETKVPLEIKGDATALDVASAHLVGGAAWPYTVREYRGTGGTGSFTCSFSFGGMTQAGQLEVLDSTAQFSGSRIVPSLLFDPGSPSEVIHSSCTGTGESDDQKTIFLDQWRAFHGDWSTNLENVGGDSDRGPWVAVLQPATYPVVGTLVEDDAPAGYGITFHETWSMKHTPLPAPKG